MRRSVGQAVGTRIPVMNLFEMPHDVMEILLIAMQYDSKQLRGIVQDWWEYAHEWNDYAQYQIHQTQVTV